jgi:hypothetical protein
MQSTIEVGDLVKRKGVTELAPSDNKVYLVAEIEKHEHSDGRPSWCKLHDDHDRLTAVKALTLVQKGSR